MNHFVRAAQWLFLTAIGFFSTSALVADYSIPVNHQHNGREHSHQLPVQGVAHRHGIGSLGQAVPKKAIPNRTVVYGGNPKVAVKPPKPSNSTVSIDPSAHVHAGRKHSHPLPAQGVYHRHGEGSTGQRIVQDSGQSGTVIYGAPQTSNPRRNDGFEVIRQNGTPGAASDNSVNNTRNYDNRGNNRYRDRPRRRNLIIGDTRCRQGEGDCNVCAANVQQQFDRAAKQQISWRNEAWRFSWPQRYPPNNLSPMDIFDGVPGHALGIPDTHVQGFVKTNSSRYPFAGSHSHKKKGGIFVIKNGGQGSVLSSLHQTPSRHPSGVHVIGKYLVYGTGSRLYFKDLESPNQQKNISLTLPNASFGGGLGVLKLADGRHLIVTSGPGGQDKRPRYNRFYVLKTVNGMPASIRFLNESSTKKPSAWPSTLRYSENISMVTECGTGDVYAIHTTGDEKGISALTGKGYWRLSKLVRSGKVLGLTAVNAFTTRQNVKSCNSRATATVHVNNRNKLEFYCHAYAKDPDGSAFNVLGRTSRFNDKFYYKVGEVR